MNEAISPVSSIYSQRTKQSPIASKSMISSLGCFSYPFSDVVSSAVEHDSLIDGDDEVEDEELEEASIGRRGSLSNSSNNNNNSGNKSNKSSFANFSEKSTPQKK